MKTFIKRLLGQLGFNYCTTCGSKLYFYNYRGYDMIPVYKCPHCDHLDRFDVDPRPEPPVEFKRRIFRGEHLVYRYKPADTEFMAYDVEIRNMKFMKTYTVTDIIQGDDDPVLNELFEIFVSECRKAESK